MYVRSRNVCISRLRIVKRPCKVQSVTKYFAGVAHVCQESRGRIGISIFRGAYSNIATFGNCHKVCSMLTTLILIYLFHSHFNVLTGRDTSDRQSVASSSALRSLGQMLIPTAMPFRVRNTKMCIISRPCASATTAEVGLYKAKISMAKPQKPCRDRLLLHPCMNPMHVSYAGQVLHGPADSG